MNRPLRWMICAAVIAMAGLAPPAFARPTRIVLTKIDGDARGVGQAVADALDDGDLTIVSDSKVERTIERLGLPAKLGDRDLEKLAAELEVDALVKGTFDRRAKKLKFTIFANGKKGKPFTIQVGNAKSDKFRKQVHTTLIAKLAAAVPADEVADDAGAADDDARPKKASKKKGTSKETDDAVAEAPADSPKQAAKGKGKTKGKKATDDAVAEADASPKQPARSKPLEEAPPAPPAAEGTTTEPPAAAPPAVAKQAAARDDEELTPATHARLEPRPRDPGHSANLVALRADLGMSMSGRDLRFKTTALVNAPKPYKNAPVPGARFEGELYPFAFHDPHSALAGLGVAGDFDQTLALTLRASAEMTVPLKTTERHYSVGLRYRFAFGHTPTSPTLTLGGGYGARTFAVNRAGLMTSDSLDLPDVNYKLFDPGLAFRLPLGGMLAVTLGGRALLVTAVGQIQRADQYGNARMLGGSGSAGLELILGNRVALRVAGEATQLTYKFDGTGALATSRDGNAATLDVRGATDRYYGGAATLAILY